LQNGRKNLDINLFNELNLNRIRNIARKVLPERLIRLTRGMVYGWHGNYSSWNEAKKRCTGYDSRIIIEKVKDSTLRVKNGKAVYERDSVLFDSIQYSYPVLSGLMWIAARNNGKLNVLDFGGAVGSSFYQNKKFLDSLNEVNWCIVEQPDFIKVGIESFEDEKLHFFYSIEECLKSFDIHVVLLSSVLQYLEKPFIILDQLKSTGIKYLIIDRTPFIIGPDRITVQKVHPKIYKGSYPCWFFNKSNFVQYMASCSKAIIEFDSLDKANIKSEFKGFLFEFVNNTL